MKATSHRESACGAFSLAEMLVAVAIAAAVLTAAAIGFAVVSGASIRGGRIDVVLPGSAHADLYGTASAFVSIWPNPNYAEAAKARILREKLLEDVSAGTAVFCLGRNGAGGVRPAAITFNAARDFRNLATPAGFRQLLIDSGLAGGNFAESAGGRLETINASIFVAGSLDSQTFDADDQNTLRFIATYEVDFVATSNPPGTYASVRRFGPESGAVPTDYYHAFYPDEANGSDGFRPLAVHFGRPGTGGGYDIAPNHPFLFLWWPDPLFSRLGGEAVPAAGGTPWRASYANMADRTALFTVVPVFPGQ
jgi:hypothetical protein